MCGGIVAMLYSVDWTHSAGKSSNGAGPANGASASANKRKGRCKPQRKNYTTEEEFTTALSDWMEYRARQKKSVDKYVGGLVVCRVVVWVCTHDYLHGVDGDVMSLRIVEVDHHCNVEWRRISP